MRNELEIMGCPIKIFTPKRRKRPAKQRGRKPIKRVKRMPKYTRPILDYLEDVTSNEVYCICKQPYVESLGWQPEWSEEEYERRRALNAMIEC